MNIQGLPSVSGLILLEKVSFGEVKVGVDGEVNDQSALYDLSLLFAGGFVTDMVDEEGKIILTDKGHKALDTHWDNEAEASQSYQ